MIDILGAILSPVPRCIYCSAPATIIDDPFMLCDGCETILVDDLKKSGFPVAPVFSSSSGVSAAASETSPPNPTVAAAINSEVPGGWSPPDRQAAVEDPTAHLEFSAAVTNFSSALDLETGAETAAGTDLSDRPLPVAVEFDDLLRRAS